MASFLAPIIFIYQKKKPNELIRPKIKYNGHLKLNKTKLK